MSQVILDRVCKQFEQIEIVKNLNLTIADQEFMVLVGPSGCGKTTTLRMIAGLETISSGTIRIGDHIINDVPPKDRDIAMVFQNYALYPHMSVFENMAFGLKMRNAPLSEIQTKVQEAAVLLDLDRVLQKKPSQLSGGQRQRVALGRAIVRHPQVFLMDEPLSNLDAKFRTQMRTEIRRLHDRLKATTIYVTHDQIEAMTMGDRIAVFHQGKIQQVGTPLAVYQQPVNTFVGGFMGIMHFLPTHYERGHLHFPSLNSWPAPESVSRIGRTEGQPLLMGIRPEHFSMVPESALSQPMEMVPLIIELLGAEKLIHFKFHDNLLKASVSADFNAEIGQPAQLFLSLGKIAWFDADNLENIVCQKVLVAT